MPRKRQIDPDIWKNEQFSSLELGARLLFIGMFSNADDEGRMKASSVYLKVTIFPADDIPAEVIHGWLTNVEKAGLCYVYRIGDTDYLFLPTWHTHQFISKPYPSKIPAPFPNHSATTPEVTNTNIKTSSLKNESLIKNDNGNDDSWNVPELWKTEVADIDGEIISLPIFWERARAYLKGRINPLTFNSEVATIRILGVNGKLIALGVRSDFHREQVDRLRELIRKALYSVTGIEYTVSFMIDPDIDCNLQFDAVVDEICESLGLAREDVLGTKREKNLVVARRNIARHMMSGGKISLTELGRLMGRHRTSVLNMVREKVGVDA